MGIPFSCLFAEDGDVESELESLLVKSISLGDGEKTPVRSVSFNGRSSEPIIMKSLGPGKMTMETSVGLRESELQKMTMVKSASVEKEKTIVESEDSKNKMINNNQCSSLESLVGMIQNMPILDLTNPKHHAALKLQKVYKSFRTRRKLADCAVLVEQSWWKLLDFAELKRSSISFFDIEKHETAISRWSRARTRAAKVGKGLSKNDKAQKLALQHWLEAIDPRHRYGHNLHFYYVKWLHCQSKEPFFYWLDIGEGKEVNMVEKCSRLKLQQQCIKYLGPMERLAYEVVVRDGKFVYKQSNEILHMSEEAKNSKWIFVLGTSRNLYVGKKQKGTFQHSSFLAGGATSAAGRLVVDNGTLKAVWPHSGHYRPTEENFKDFVLFLEEQNVDLTDVKMSPVEDGDELLNQQKSGKHLRSNSSDDDLVEKMIGQEDDEINGEEEISTGISDSPEKATAPLNTTQPSKSKRLHILARELSNLEIPKREELIERLERESQEAGKNSSASTSESPAEEASGIERDYWVPKKNLFDEEDEEKEAEEIPEESILKRINSHKGMKSLQLGKQLSCKWTTGAGPRIGCVRDYPAELQFRALEQVSLSPRSGSLSRSLFSSSTRGQELGKENLSKCLIFS